MSKVVDLWIRPRPHNQSLEDYLDGSDLHLAILTVLRLSHAWDAELNLILVVDEGKNGAIAYIHLAELCNLCRIPDSVRYKVMVGPFDACVSQAPQSDIDVIGLRRDHDSLEPDLDFVANMVRASGSTCLLCATAGKENALA